MRKAALFSILIIVSCMAVPVHGQKGIDVISIEYPPFTTLQREDGGLAFQLLQQKTSDASIKWRPLFVPPARAAKLVHEGNWCASFYPVSNNDNVRSIVLSDSDVRLGLVRKATDHEFAWESLDELEGGILATLRTRVDSPFIQQFTDAGITVVFVESIASAIQMVLLNRVDMALSDDLTFSNMELENKKQLDFSETYLLKTPIVVYLNEGCTESFGQILH
ncbi:hypothetical protein [Alteromonas facilis]|uniref:hypothetical protein n=1 Tax=Alteromonas facilis TaxID=2048004 RepID=UPI000C289D23|nr:hypothetical protein [Alteromonas facilis]